MDSLERGGVSHGGEEGNAEASIDLGTLIGQQESSRLVNMVGVAGMGGERRRERGGGGGERLKVVVVVAWCFNAQSVNQEREREREGGWREREKEEEEERLYKVVVIACWGFLLLLF